MLNVAYVVWCLKVTNREILLLLTGAVGLLFVSSAVTMAVPFGIGRVIDIIYTSAEDGQMVEQLTRFCKILLVIFIVGAIANFGRIYFMQTSGS